MAEIHDLVARVPLISSTSRGPIVNLVGWITMVTMILAVSTVLVSKMIVLRKLGWTDLIIALAMLFSVAFTVAISSQVSHGLGSPLHSITHADYITFQKAGYASQILYICALTCAKFSTLALLTILTPQKSHRLPIFIVGGIVALWSISSIFGSAFQCSLPKPYLYTSGECFNQSAFWDAVGAVDIFTDLALMALPIMVVSHLQLPLKKKAAVSFAFSFRIFSVGCTIFRLVEYPKKTFRHGNVTLDSWLFTVATELETFFSIFAACIPHLRPFMESIQSGYLGGAIHEGEARTGYGSQNPGDSYAMGKMSNRNAAGKPIGLSTKNSAISYVGGPRHERNDADSIDLPRHGQRAIEHVGEKSTRPTYIGQAIGTNEVRTTIGRGESQMRDRSDSNGSEGRGSSESVGSKAMIIKTTKEWSVSYQE